MGGEGFAFLETGFQGSDFGIAIWKPKNHFQYLFLRAPYYISTMQDPQALF